MSMKIKLLIASIIILIFSQGYSANKKTVAVMNFKNYGSRSIRGLSKSIPEAISSILSGYSEINVAERSQLGKIINEISLGQTGLLNTRGIERAGKLLSADILILGSLSGNRNSVVVTIKAVSVTTGKVIEGRVVKGKIKTILKIASQTARTMVAAISGKGIGKLTISTTPVGAVIFIDGVKVGNSPIVDYKVIEGKHRIRTVLKEYMDYTGSVVVKKNQTKIVDPYMVKQKSLSRYEMSIGAYFDLPFPISPLETGDLQPGFMVNGTFGYQFFYILVKGEIAFGRISHSQEIDDIVGTVEMNFYYLNFLLHINYIPFPTWRYVQPYIGAFLGSSGIFDSKTILGAPENVSSKFLFNWGASLGINVLPLGGFCLFLETRVYFNTPSITLNKYKAEGYFIVKDTNKTVDFNLMGWTIGLGARLYF